MNIDILAPVLAAWAKMQATAVGSNDTGKQSFNTLFLLALLAENEKVGEGVPAAPPALNGHGGAEGVARENTRNRPAIPLPASTNIQTLIGAIAARYNLSPDLLRGVVAAESGFNPRAVSPAGALGLMQLMPATARALGVNDPFDPAANLDGGARYLRQLLDRFQGDTRLALAAYNAGPGAVERYHGVPPYKETRAYIQRVLAAAGQLEVLV
ncbi:lytic transglycosylase domain-containing protein [Moorella sp. Hama-1]|uniref:lytic transglycosylase domain-containing protein n=1 Tax=Moorella sp. Hama-1 TaxID=2138101 RepID=UPI001F45ADA7|nr:lytic transglycosylase domain-containing protein [Moorella sp. Hama-1]BCV21855.1 lytic transglycosylase catalytic [Moorella sp. Hama-1]